MLLLTIAVDSIACLDKPSALLNTLSLLANVGLAKASIDLYSIMFLGVSTVSSRSWHVRTSPMVLLANDAACKSLCGVAMVDSLASFGVKLVAWSISSTLEAIVKSSTLEAVVCVLFVDTEGSGKEFPSNKASERRLLHCLGSSGKEVGDFLPFGGTEGNITALLLIRLRGKASLGLVFTVSSLQLSISPMQFAPAEVDCNEKLFTEGQKCVFVAFWGESVVSKMFAWFETGAAGY